MNKLFTVLPLVLALLLPKVAALEATFTPLRESTYCVGVTESPSGKSYQYCRQLSVEMVRRLDGESFDFRYRLTDDQGKPLKENSGRLNLKAEELKDFATICYQAWDLMYKQPAPPPAAAMAVLEKFRDIEAYFHFGSNELTIRSPGSIPGAPDFLHLPLEGVCATLSLLSRTPEGHALVGDHHRFRIGIKKEPVTTPFKEQEEIELSGSIVKKSDAGNWRTWMSQVVSEVLDFNRLSNREEQYLLHVFVRPGPPSELGSRMNSNTGFIVRLKLNDPETLKDLRESFRVGYFDADDAADACRRAANIKLLPIAAEFLFTDEAPKTVEMSDVIVSASPGVHSAAAIGAMLVVCPEFPEHVRKSAKSWQRYGSMADDFLNPCREWWNENRVRIEKGQYKEVTALPMRK